MNRIAVLVLFLFGVFPSGALAKVTAHIYEDKVAINSVFDLIVVSDSNQGVPDFSILEKDFIIEKRNEEHHIGIVNGRKIEKKQWIVQLKPRKVGKLPIPPITVGNEVTKLLVVNVVAATKQDPSNFKFYLLEGELDTTTPYVQAQMIFTVKLLYVNGIALSGQLEEPVDADNFLVEKLGDDIRYRTRRYNCNYNVLERKYAVFPQKSGKIRIPVVTFEGNMDLSGVIDCKDAATRSLTMNPRNFFSQGKEQARTKRLDIDVKPIPKEFGSDAWLPAKSLTISQTWSPNLDQFKVGQPVTRTITLTAKGLTAIQLPDIPGINDDNFKSYSDKARTVNNFARDLIISEKEQKIAMIANKKGSYQLPDIKIKWWDTQADRMRTATLNGAKIVVKASPVSVKPLQSKLSKENTKNEVQVTEPQKNTSQEEFWKILSIALMVLWIATLIVMFFRRGESKPKEKHDRKKEREVSYAKLKREIYSACKEGNSAKAKKNLLLIASKKWPEEKITTLVALAHKLENKTLQKSILDLDQSLYSKNQSWNGESLGDSVNEIFVENKTEKSDKTNGLPGLYPGV